MSEAENYAQRSKESWYQLASLDTDKKNEFLGLLGKRLIERKDFILSENMKDLEEGKSNGLSSALLDRPTRDHILRYAIRLSNPEGMWLALKSAVS